MFLIVTGIPGSGKSTLAARLAPALGLPLIDKDDFLEDLFELEAGTSRSELSRRADQKFQRAAEATTGAVLVSWWKHPRSQAPSGTPSGWLSALPGPRVEIYCSCDPHIAAERFRSRIRHPLHEDNLRSGGDLVAQLSAHAVLGPLGLAPLVSVNTESAVDISAVLLNIAAAVR